MTKDLLTHLLVLVHVYVVLCDPLERELVHQVDLVRIGYVFLRKVTHVDREGRRKEKNLSVFVTALENLFAERRHLPG